MKHLITIALFASLASLSIAHAGKPGNNGGGNGGCGVGQTTNGCGGGGAGIGVGKATAIAAQAQGQVQAQQQHQNAQAISGGNTVTSTTTVQAQERNPVSTAYAPALAAHNCLGSTSGGAQGAAFGFSIGSTKLDQDCNARADADALSRMGKPRAALARLCQREDIAKAIEASGEQCPTKPAQPVSAVKTADYTGSDPIVRARLGLGE